MSSCQLMFPGVRSSLLFSGFGLKPPAYGFQSYLYSSLKTSISVQHNLDVRLKLERLKVKDEKVKDEEFLYSEGHSERFTELHGEEKREEGVRGDPNEMRWNQKRREQASQ